MTTLTAEDMERLAKVVFHQIGLYWLDRDDQLQTIRAAIVRGAPSCDGRRDHKQQWGYLYRYAKTYLIKHNKKEIAWSMGRIDSLEEDGEGGSWEKEKGEECPPMLARMLEEALARLPAELREKAEKMAVDSKTGGSRPWDARRRPSSARDERVGVVKALLLELA